jgi:type VI secretion system secreted protein VgrG
VQLGGSYVSGPADSQRIYSNSFTCVPSNITFRPPRITRKPMIHGVQTALVVGPSGEEIWPDKYGRVKVQFYWDREGKKDE